MNSNLSSTVSLKTPAAKKMRLRVIGYFQGKYLYTLSNQGILLSFKDYGIIEQNEMVALAA